MTNLAKIQKEVQWLKENPDFEERPATLLEFLGEGYLEIEDKVRASIKRELSAIMGQDVRHDKPTEYSLAMITGGIGIGKTTVASIVLPYLCHWVLCLKDPQDFFGLLPGSRIAFMQMSTSEQQAREVVFGDIFARVRHSPWFMNRYPFDPRYTKQVRFPKDIWILPGDSAETTFEGYNILGGILDEADSHKVTKNKDYAEAGYTTIHSRITSRFEDKGFLLVIGQMKKSVGFAATKFEEFRQRDDAYAVRMAIWESLGWDHYADRNGHVDTFKYDVKRKMVVPDGVAAHATKTEQIIEIPKVFLNDFTNNPEKALRDLAGIPPVVGDPFISLVHKIEDCRDRWLDRYDTDGEGPVDEKGRIRKWFRAPDTLKRAGHIDIAFSANGDHLGLAIGHVREMVQVEDEIKPYIVFDMLMRMHAPSGGEIFLGDVRRLIYSLRDDFGFKIDFVSMDGFESTDTKQQFRRKRISSDIVSIDRDVLPYHDLREAIYEDRLEFPPYYVKYNPNDNELTEVAVKELMELVDEGGKIDHPPDGSKDVADAIAGVTYHLMGDRRYHKKVVRMSDHMAQRSAVGDGTRPLHHAMTGSTRPTPIPPDIPDWARPPR